jgi:diguanylate cyclase (GGDEF)-like protein
MTGEPAYAEPVDRDEDNPATAESAVPANPVSLPATAASTPIPTARNPATPLPSRETGKLVLLLLLALGAVLLAWWASIRRSRELARQTERLSRQQRYLKSAHSHLRRKSQQLQQLSMHDPLTGTLNRQAFVAELRERIDHLAKYSQPLTLIVFDLDHFKAINDRHGHLLGDAALRLVVGVVREHLVSDDLFGRFGGDEFMIACSGQQAQQTAAMAEKIRLAVAQQATAASPPIPGLTLSMGLAQADPEHGYLADALFARADAALYRAKQQGRNRIAVDDDSQRQIPDPGITPRHL